MQWTHYYPYGLPIERMSSMYYYNREPENRLLMTCKEWNDEQGLNEYDFGGRSYDPATIRWYVMDPAEQFHNPYFAIGGNPVVGVDPDGRMTIFGSMGIGALFGGLGYLMQGNISFEGFAKATLQGAVSGAVSFGVGVGFGEVSSNLTHELGRAFSHSVNQNLVGAAFGQKVTAGSLLSSGLGSLAGSGMEAGKFGVAEKMMGSMMVGGITSHLGGGNFWQGAMMSGLVEATNHVSDVHEERRKLRKKAQSRHRDTSLNIYQLMNVHIMTQILIKKGIKNITTLMAISQIAKDIGH